jgi:uncharacterized RDD family membrane protein YckC
MTPDSEFLDNPYAAPMSEVGPGSEEPKANYIGYAGFWVRFVAYFIDNIITSLLSMLGGFFLGVVIGVSGAGNGNQAQVQSVSFVVGMAFGFAVALFYFAGMESSASQATLGKMAMGLKVTDLYGRRISFGRAAGRFVGKMVSGLILCVGYLMIAFTDKKQGLHDIMANTLVLRTR